MADEAQNTDYSMRFFEEITKIKDLEEKQRMLKDRLLMIGESLVEIKEETDSKILEIKKDLEIIKQNMVRLMSFLESASAEFQKFAKKEDLEILSKQAKMFQPMDFVKKEDLENFRKK